MTFDLYGAVKWVVTTAAPSNVTGMRIGIRMGQNLIFYLKISQITACKLKCCETGDQRVLCGAEAAKSHELI